MAFDLKLRASVHVPAGVDGERESGDEIGLVGDRERDTAGDVVRGAGPTGRDALDDPLRRRADHVGVDMAGRDALPVMPWPRPPSPTPR